LEGYEQDSQHLVRPCVTYEACKYDNSASHGLLQPLPIPEEVRVDVSMDFIEGLPKSFGKRSDMGSAG